MVKTIKSNASSTGKLKVGMTKDKDGSVNKGPKQPKPIGLKKK